MKEYYFDTYLTLRRCEDHHLTVEVKLLSNRNGRLQTVCNYLRDIV